MARTIWQPAVIGPMAARHDQEGGKKQSASQARRDRQVLNDEPTFASESQSQFGLGR
jgi:hypothetical protein